MSTIDRIKPIPLVTFNSLTLTGDYKPLNPDGLPYACSYIKIRNFSDYNIDISYVDEQTHEYLPILGEVEHYLQKGARPTNNIAMLKQGSIIYVKRASGGLKGGSIYLSGWYTHT